MVQSKKDEVRKEIEYAALKVFFEKGYVDAKMSDIANEINFSVVISILISRTRKNYSTLSCRRI